MPSDAATGMPPGPTPLRLVPKSGIVEPVWLNAQAKSPYAPATRPAPSAADVLKNSLRVAMLKPPYVPSLRRRGRTDADASELGGETEDRGGQLKRRRACRSGAGAKLSPRGFSGRLLDRGALPHRAAPQRTLLR